MANKGRRVYIHLGYDLDVGTWQQRYRAGIVPDETPYGDHHLEEWGYSLAFSTSHGESKAVNLLRRAANRVMGFDLWHAWRNRKNVSGVDAILTHSEKEHLAILLLRRWKISSPNTLLVAHCVWLLDIWQDLPRWKRGLYRWLIQNDAHTSLAVLSEENLKIARSLFPGMRSEFLRFGVSLNSFPLRPPTFVYERGIRPLRLLSLGNDMHRDWGTLIEAVEGNKAIELRIATNLSYKHNRSLKRFADTFGQVMVKPLRSLHEIHEAYGWADIVVVPLIPNRHVSGITVVLEAVAAGKPVIATDTGGLRGYFSDDEICYVPPLDVKALAEATKECVKKPGNTLLRARNAQAKLTSAELTTRGVASRHVALIEGLLSSTV